MAARNPRIDWNPRGIFETAAAVRKTVLAAAPGTRNLTVRRVSFMDLARSERFVVRGTFTSPAALEAATLALVDTNAFLYAPEIATHA